MHAFLRMAGLVVVVVIGLDVCPADFLLHWHRHGTGVRRITYIIFYAFYRHLLH